MQELHVQRRGDVVVVVFLTSCDFKMFVTTVSVGIPFVLKAVDIVGKSRTSLACISTRVCYNACEFHSGPMVWAPLIFCSK